MTIDLQKYSLEYTEAAKKTLYKLDKNTAKAVQAKLEKLMSGSANLDIKKLQGYSDPIYRLRVGDIRVIYEVHNNQLIVLVIRIGPRKEVYEK